MVDLGHRLLRMDSSAFVSAGHLASSPEEFVKLDLLNLPLH
jgi:hypothetical protein